VISDCHLSFYLVCSGKKCGVLHTFLKGLVQLRVYTDTQHLVMPMDGKSSKYGIPTDHITWWDLVEHSPSILDNPTFCIHVNQATAHTDIWIPSTSNDLLISTPALFKCNNDGTCIQHPTKLTEFGRTTCCLCIAFVKIIPVPSALACISHVQISGQPKSPHFQMASCWTPSKYPPWSQILHTCQPSYFPQKHLQSHPLSMICS